MTGLAGAAAAGAAEAAPLPACDARRRQAVDRGMAFLLSRGGDRGIEPATVSLADGEPLTGPDARAQIRRRGGVDIGVDPADEAFSAMMALALLRPPQSAAERERRHVPHERVQDCRWQHRYRFFRARTGFASDTDCTAVTAAALRTTGYCTDSDLDTYARVLLTAASPGRSRTFRWDDEAVQPGRMMVYWEDDAEPRVSRRGRKYDPTVCANVLYVLEQVTIPGQAHPRVLAANRGYVGEHLTSGRYLAGTRYYPSPASFVYALSRLHIAFPDRYGALGPVLAAAVAAAGQSDPLGLALTILAADNLGHQSQQEERRAALMAMQRPDGSWPFCPLYSLGRQLVYFGSADITHAGRRQSTRRPEHESPTLTELERELDHYRSATPTEIQWRLTREIAEQAVAHCRCEGGITRHTKHAYGAATFDVHCSPTDAAYRERLRDGQYLLCFFLANELELGKLRAFIDHADRIWAGQESGGGELEANYAILAESLRGSGFDHHAFHAAFLRVCQAMQDEQAADPATIPKQRYVTLRRHTIGVRPLLAYWDTQRAVRFGHRAARLWTSSAITELVLDAIWLCNDLFSMENDLFGPPPGEPPISLNGILIDARDSGDLTGALDAGEAEYNQKTQDIEQIIRHATNVAADLNEPLLPFRARTAARMVNGNLRGTQLMVPVRYPAAGRLPRLRTIEY